MPDTFLLAIPVFNEQGHVCRVIREARRHCPEILVVDDGSTDATPDLLERMRGIHVLTHAENRGYGKSLADSFAFSIRHGYDWLITMDCDEQHEPDAIPAFLEAAAADAHDVISGSRYLPGSGMGGGSPPADRRAINTTVTRELNQRLGLDLTDAFCGFKAYRVKPLRRLRLTVKGYAFPMQFWVQAVANGLRIREVPVRLIYNDPNRSFGGPLDNPERRLAHYRRVLAREIRRCAPRLPCGAATGLEHGRTPCTFCGP